MFLISEIIWYQPAPLALFIGTPVDANVVEQLESPVPEGVSAESTTYRNSRTGARKVRYFTLPLFRFQGIAWLPRHSNHALLQKTCG